MIRLTEIVHMLDIDNTTGLEHGPATEPHDICDAAMSAIRALHDRGDLVMLVTGTAWDLAHKVADKLGLPARRNLRNAVAVAADYGSAIIRTDGLMDVMVDGFELEAFNAHKAAISAILEGLGAQIDGRHVRYQINAFWDDARRFELARDNFAFQVDADPVLKTLFRGNQEAGGSLLKEQFNPTDLSVNILPACAGKQNAVRWASLRGLHVGVAAGDSGSDRPMLEAADWPIVTIKNEGDEPNKFLVEILQRKGRGFIATRANGLGLADGINAYLKYLETQAA